MFGPDEILQNKNTDSAQQQVLVGSLEEKNKAKLEPVLHFGRNLFFFNSVVDKVDCTMLFLSKHMI